MRLQKQMEHKLMATFEPLHMELVNESHNHNVPPNSETHFKLVMVSNSFEGKVTVMRHRQVNKTLADELAGGVHALTMKLLTPKQWHDAGGQTHHESPACMHKK